MTKRIRFYLFLGANLALLLVGGIHIVLPLIIDFAHENYSKSRNIFYKADQGLIDYVKWACNTSRKNRSGLNVFILSASQGYAPELSDDENYTALLTQALNDGSPNSRKVRLFNLATPGASGIRTNVQYINELKKNNCLVDLFILDSFYHRLILKKEDYGNHHDLEKIKESSFPLAKFSFQNFMQQTQRLFEYSFVFQAYTASKIIYEAGYSSLFRTQFSLWLWGPMEGASWWIQKDDPKKWEKKPDLGVVTQKFNEAEKEGKPVGDFDTAGLSYLLNEMQKFTPDVLILLSPTWQDRRNFDAESRTKIWGEVTAVIEQRGIPYLDFTNKVPLVDFMGENHTNKNGHKIITEESLPLIRKQVDLILSKRNSHAFQQP